MPRATGSSATPAPAPTSQPGTGLVRSMPEDIRRELLNAQKGMLGERAKLSQIKIMNAGVGMFEFTDDPSTNPREFTGVILGSHDRNVLWDKAFGVNEAPAAGSDGSERLPACSSNDGLYGVPRQGFRHAALSRTPNPVAVGTERINCKTCPYNQWSSRGLIPAKLRPGEDPATAKGKAVSNYRILYVMMAGREVPMEMIIPSTSISSYDEYLSSLIQRGIPVQGIVTKFTQQQQSKNGQRFCTALFTMEAELDDQGFANAMAMRTQWRNEIEGRVEELVEATVENAAAPAVQSLEDQATGAAPDDEDIPF
jgi:hypothetical protein